MNYIDAELRLYNANSRSRNVRDCVKRSLSLAYGMDYDDLFYDELREFVSASMHKFLKKMPYASFDIDPYGPYGKQKSKDEYLSQITVHLFLNKEIRNELNIPSIREKYGKSFAIKMNPKFMDEENLQKIKDKLYYNLREWCYANRKAIQDILDSRKLVTHPKFSGERNLLLKIPEEYRNKIISIYDRGNNDWGDRYYVNVEADPNDPRYNPKDSEITIYGENLKELIYNLKSYYAQYKIFRYDYTENGGDSFART